MQTSIEKRQYWQERIRQWQESGLSQAEFCRQTQTNLKRFYQWRSTLKPHSEQSGIEERAASDFIQLAIDPGIGNERDRRVIITINDASLTLEPNSDRQLIKEAIELLREVS